MPTWVHGGGCAPFTLRRPASLYWSELVRLIQGLAFRAEILYITVQDGHFVPNLTLGAPVIAALRKHTRCFLDCHLMVTTPEQWVDDFAKAGADGFTFHIEATSEYLALGNFYQAGARLWCETSPLYFQARVYSHCITSATLPYRR